MDKITVHTLTLLLSRKIKASWKRLCLMTHYSGNAGRKKRI
jgi:hypothetical protein